jgi:hypothetical protein
MGPTLDFFSTVGSLLGVLVLLDPDVDPVPVELLPEFVVSEDGGGAVYAKSQPC